MAIDRELVVEQRPVKVDQDKLGKDIICKCCETHSTKKFAILRRSPHSMYLDLPKMFEALGAKEIISHAQSESDGNVTISIIYK